MAESFCRDGFIDQGCALKTGVAMRLRTYLILSYLALIAILVVGAWFIDAHVMGELTKSAIKIADQAVSQVTEANVLHSDRILTQMGKYVVRDKAEDVARELAHVLERQNQGRLRQTAPGPPDQGHRHPVDLHPARFGGVYGFI